MADEKKVENTEKLNDMDRMALELVKSREQTARAQFEAAVINTRHAILQIYMKYGLTEADAIKEDGTIIKGGAQVTAPEEVK